MLEYYAPEIVLPSDVIVSVQIDHSTFRLGISSKVNKLLSQMEILFYYCLFGILNIIPNVANIYLKVHLFIRERS